MNTNPSALRILIFGDSNTWGDRPVKGLGRYGPRERYSCVLQDLLGEKYEIIEEGMCARTICASSPREEEAGRVGITYLRPCIESHAPLDLLVLNLGTNDFKSRFGLGSEDVANNLDAMCTLINERVFEIAKRPGLRGFQTLVLSPAYADDSKVKDEYKGLGELSRAIGPLFKEVAQKHGFHFLDLGPIAEPGEDGLHYSLEAHRAVAEALAQEVRKILT